MLKIALKINFDALFSFFSENTFTFCIVENTISQQARSAKFQAETAIDKRVLCCYVN